MTSLAINTRERPSGNSGVRRNSRQANMPMSLLLMPCFLLDQSGKVPGAAIGLDTTVMCKYWLEDVRSIKKF